MYKPSVIHNYVVGGRGNGRAGGGALMKFRGKGGGVGFSVVK